jgi:hypothetical protein
MGGAGVASSKGLASSGHNPANLMLFEREQRWEFRIGNAMARNKHGFDLSATGLPADHLHAYFFSSVPPVFPSTGSPEKLRSSWFPDETTTFGNHLNASVMTAGLSYTGRRFGISIAHYIRASNIYDVDRGWYDTTPVQIDNLNIIQRDIRLNTSLRHEIGVAVAWEYDLLSGWLSDLGKIIIGIHPKVILPIHHGNVNIHSLYSVSDDGQNSIVHSSRLNSTTTGELTAHYMEGIANIRNAMPVELYPSQSILGSFSGIGGGFDAGITYVIGLGRDISLISTNRDPLRNSFRLSFSITDIGIISHTKSIVRLRSPLTLTLLNSDKFPPDSNTEFTGNPYSLIHFLNASQEQNLFSNAEEGDSGPVRVLLPGRLQLGSAIQYGPVLIAAELQYQAGSNQLESSYMSYHVGTELGVIGFMPLRWGMIFQAGEPIMYTAGFGLDFKYFALNIGASMITDDSGNGILPTAAATSGLEIRF